MVAVMREIGPVGFGAFSRYQRYSRPPVNRGEPDPAADTPFWRETPGKFRDEAHVSHHQSVEISGVQKTELPAPRLDARWHTSQGN